MPGRLPLALPLRPGGGSFPSVDEPALLPLEPRPVLLRVGAEPPPLLLLAPGAVGVIPVVRVLDALRAQVGTRGPAQLALVEVVRAYLLLLGGRLLGLVEAYVPRLGRRCLLLGLALDGLFEELGVARLAVV